MNNELFYKESIPKLYMKMALPVVFSMIIALVYNLADTYFVASTNNTNLIAGVSLGAPVFTFLMALGNIFGQGGASLLSRLLGKNDMEDVHKVSAWCFYMSIIVGLLIMVFLLVLYQPMLTILGATKETFIYAKEYYVWLVIGAPMIVCSFVHGNLLRTEGMAKESMIATVGGSVVNIILDPIFISALGLGAAGAAIASVVGYSFTTIYNFTMVKKRSRCMSVSYKVISISGNYIRQIISIGLTAAITNIMQSFGVIFLNHGLLPYGNDRIAAMGIAIKISMIVSMVMVGLTFGGQPLYGFYYGADDKKRLKDTIFYAAKMISLIGIGLSVVVFVAATPLMNLFVKNQAIINNGAVMLRLQVVTMLFVGLIMLITVLFQSTGNAVPALILSVSRQGVVFVLMILVLSNLFGYYGVLVSQAVADAITMVIAGVLFVTQLYRQINGPQH